MWMLAVCVAAALILLILTIAFKGVDSLAKAIVDTAVVLIGLACALLVCFLFKLLAALFGGSLTLWSILKAFLLVGVLAGILGFGLPILELVGNLLMLVVPYILALLNVVGDWCENRLKAIINKLDSIISPE